jgi:hypothetical protein
MDLIHFTCPNNPALEGMGGVANGYVALHPYHPCYKMGYDSIYQHFDIDVHGGLTYADWGGHLYKPSVEVPAKWWVVGFDTMHGSDLTGFLPGIGTYNEILRGHEASRWQKMEEVELEALRLKWQLEEIDTNKNRLKMAWVRLGVKENVSEFVEKVKKLMKFS